MAKPATDDARKLALRLIGGLRQGQSLSDQSPTLRGVPGAVQARALRLATETLRHRGRADQVLAAFLSRRPAPAVQEILQLATVEMLELGGAPHGVVDAAVGMTRGLGRKGQAATGMVNAVLRKVAGYEGWAALPPQQMPDWLRGPVLAAYGESATSAIEAAHQAGAPLDLTLRPGATVQIEGAVSLPTGSLRLKAPGQVSALPGYATGDWWVQDAAAALAVRMLQPQPGERIADLCAAPGGKTLQLAAAGARVEAVDISPARLARLRENLARTGLEAELIAGDALNYHPDQAPDAVLLDAPCSATGTIRRHPDLPFLRDGSGIAALVELQARLLDHALNLLRPGGRLVYATCSLLPDEGEAQIAAALTRHEGLMVETPALPGIEPGWILPEGGLRLRPDYWSDLGGMDGFYIARLRKT